VGGVLLDGRRRRRRRRRRTKCQAARHYFHSLDSISPIKLNFDINK